MARFTLSVSDDVAAALDAYAAGNELNRSQAAEKIFRSFLSPDSGGGGDGEERGEQAAGDLAYLSDQVLEVQESQARSHPAGQLIIHNADGTFEESRSYG